MTSLTVPPSSSLTPLEVRERGLDPAEAAVRADLDVEGGVGSAPARPRECAGGDGGVEQLVRRPARAAEHAAKAPVDLAGADDALDHRLGEELRAGRLGVGDPLLERGRRRFRRLLEVEEDGGDVDAGDAVDHAVVGLADDREAAVLEALDQPQLPQRLRAVELLGEEARGEVAELLLAAGRGKRGVAHVVARGSGAGRRPRPGDPGRRARSGPSGGSAARGAGARRCGRGTRRRGERGPRRGSSRRRACGRRRARGAGRRSRVRSGGRSSAG